MRESKDLTITPGESSGSYVLIPAQEPEPDRGFSEFLADGLRIIRKRKGAVILTSLLGLLAGVAWVLPQPPVYQSSASIEVQTPNDDFLYSRDVSPSTNTGGMFPDYDMATQVRILSTKSLLDRVVAKLIADPSVNVRVPEDRAAAWRKALRLPAGRAAGRSDVIEATAASLKVQSSRGSRVIEIECESVDPQLTAVFLNTLAREYIEQSVERRWQTAQHTEEWLERQLDGIKVKLEKSEDQLQNYASAMNLVFTGDDKAQTNVADEKLSELQKALSEAQSDRISKQARYELVGPGKSDSVGQVQDDPSLRSLEMKLADLRRELADATQSYGPANMKVKKIQAQIAETESDRKKVCDRIVERIYNDYREADRREKLLTADYQAQSAVLSDQAGKITHYGILKREVDINRQLYESLLQKVKESGISAALRASNIQVIDAAQPPVSPTGPHLRFAAVCGLFLGLTGGIGIATVSERLSRAIVAPGDAGFHLGLPELGVIPAYSIDRAAPAGFSLPLATFSKAADELSLVPLKSQSLTAESFRALLTSILYAARKRPARVLAVCSPGAGEGKTSVLSNLALAFAETNRNVLMIDCDTRKPRLHAIFGVSNEKGLLDLLAAKDPLDGADIVRGWQPTSFPGVCLLPSGEGTDSSAALLHSQRLAELIDLARRQFDIVLIDTPPLLPLADARIVSSLVDGVVLVVRSGQTTRESLSSVKRRLNEDGIPIFGVALNDWNPKAAGYYGYEYYRQYYAYKDGRKGKDGQKS